MKDLDDLQSIFIKNNLKPMIKQASSDLIQFLQPFPDSVKETTLVLRGFVWSLYPDANELIYDNYNALAIGFSVTDKVGDVFCSIAVYSTYVNFGFNRGSEISDPENRLQGKGNLYRRIKVTQMDDFPKDYIEKLLNEAYANSLSRLQNEQVQIKGQIITKSISQVKRRPRIS